MLIFNNDDDNVAVFSLMRSPAVSQVKKLGAGTCQEVTIFRQTAANFREQH